MSEAGIQGRGFSGNPKVEHLRFWDPHQRIPMELFDGRHGVLLEDLTYVDRAGRSHTAKKGLIFDGGSIPRFFWRAIEDPWGVWLPAYVIHDWYCQAAADSVGEYREKWQKMADELFDEMLDCLGVGWVKRSLMVRAVKLAHLW